MQADTRPSQARNLPRDVEMQYSVESRFPPAAWTRQVFLWSQEDKRTREAHARK